jgi:hypothetical protein
MMHHLLRVLGSSNTLKLRLSNRTDDRGRRYLSGPAQDTLRWPSWCCFGCYNLVDVFHVGLQVSFLLKFFVTKVATILVVTLSMNTNHVATQTAFAFKLFEADIAVIAGSLMLSQNMHIPATC